MREPPTVEDLRAHFSTFGIYDYAVFVGILMGSALFGIDRAFRRKTWPDDANEYLMGGKKMSVFPVVTSLITSFIPGIALLRIPTEIYLHGTEYAFACIAIALTGFISSYLILPVFHEMRLISAYGYLEIRFDRNVRLLGSLMFMVCQMCWLPVVVYVPALALSEVTGININIVTPSVCLICILYTCLGGLKAAIWSGVVPIWCMVGTAILVGVKGSLDGGGFEEVWRKNYEGGRLVVPTLEADMTVRNTLWGICVGGLITHLQGNILNQNVLQRYLSLPSVSTARRALWGVISVTIALLLVSCYAGLVTYALYRDCDPLATQLAKSKDQLLPLLMMKTLGHLPGLPGLFAAGIFGASMSSLSAGLTSLSAVALEDFIKPYLKKELGGLATGIVLRGAVLIFGASFIFFLFVVDRSGTALQLSAKLGAMTSGPAFAIFFGGLFLPWVNAKGALFGGLLGLFASGAVIVGSENAAAAGRGSSSKPTSVEGCLYYYNATFLGGSGLENSNAAGSAVFPLFKLNHLWYAAFGGFATVVLALLMSAASGFSDLEGVNPKCLSPVVRNWLPTSKSHKPKYEFPPKGLKR